MANMSLHRQALMYEAVARGTCHKILLFSSVITLSPKLAESVMTVAERFIQVLVNSTPLHVLDICEVCGSYQCPYCPHYNTAATIAASYLVILTGIVLLIYS